MRWYLLNEDGVYPNGMTEERCKNLGLTPVLSFPPPIKPGYVAIEQHPEHIEGKGWVQKWSLELAPEPEPEEIVYQNLSPAQFEYVLSFGLGDVWDILESSLKERDRELYAKIRVLRKKEWYEFEATIEMVENFKQYLPENVDVSRETISELWVRATTVT